MRMCLKGRIVKKKKRALLTWTGCHFRKCVFAGGKAYEYAKFVKGRIWQVAWLKFDMR